jgi:anti-sigma factor RsiW
MSDRSDHSEHCAALADDLPLLALGTLDGRDRAAVLHHVDRCERCRGELDQLSQVSETLQQLAPSVQPPLGFESRVVERLHEVTIARRRFSRRSVLNIAAAAVVVLAIAGALVAHGVGNSGRASVVSASATADLLSAGKVVGSVVVSPGNPPWMLVTVQGGQWEGTVTCQVTLADGTVATVGTFALSGAYPSWTAQLPSSGAAVMSARLVDAHGVVLATARLDA